MHLLCKKLNIEYHLFMPYTVNLESAVRQIFMTTGPGFYNECIWFLHLDSTYSNRLINEL